MSTVSLLSADKKIVSHVQSLHANMFTLISWHVYGGGLELFRKSKCPKFSYYINSKLLNYEYYSFYFFVT